MPSLFKKYYRKRKESKKDMQKLANIKIKTKSLKVNHVTLGKGLSFCSSKHDIKCARILSTTNTASEDDFPSRSSAANAIAKSPHCNHQVAFVRQ